MVITGPKKETIVQPTEAQVLTLFDEVKNEKLTAYEDKATIKDLVAPFKSTGKIVKTESDAKLGTTTFTLNNGAKVTYKKTDFKDDEIVSVSYTHLDVYKRQFLMLSMVISTIINWD